MAHETGPQPPAVTASPDAAPPDDPACADCEPVAPPAVIEAEEHSARGKSDEQHDRAVASAPPSRPPARLLDQRLLNLRLKRRDTPLEITILLDLRNVRRRRDGHNCLAIGMTLV